MKEFINPKEKSYSNHLNAQKKTEKGIKAFKKKIL